MPPTQTASAMIHLYSEMASKLNFACHQSAFPLLRDLRIENKSREAYLTDLLVTLSANPAFVKPKSWVLDRLGPGDMVPIKNRDIELDGDFLLHLVDSVRGSITISVQQGGALLAQESTPVDLLAYNEWGGASYMPELLAAFSMPNDPAVDRVLRDASLILRRAGKPDGIDGYHARSRQRVWEIASAIYTAVCNLGISYALPPASFERNGQKIRLPSQILDGRVATCLDTTMLFASALEQAGFNPVVALPQGHALVGVWLQPEELATIVVDEAEILRKRIQLKELILIETTFVTLHPAPPFSKAIAAATDCIAPDKDSTFLVAIDIRRARAHRIMPLGAKTSPPAPASGAADGPPVDLTLEESPSLPDFDDAHAEENEPETPAGRLERWQRKLLDLSLRNPLLNHKASKASLPLICPAPALLEDKLAGGARIAIQPLTRLLQLGQDEAVHRQRTGDVITEQYAREALEKRQVLVALSEEELNTRAVEIYRKAQTALQEGGANTLYLAIGVLLWKQTEKDERRLRAPLILLPVTLERKSVRSGFSLLAHDDEPRFNTTLLEMLRKDFGIDIHGLDGPLPVDDSGIDVHGIWNKVRKAVKDAPGFEVIEDVVLGHFSFAKYLMWKDLVERTEDLRQNPVVKHLLDTPYEPYRSHVESVGEADLDHNYSPSDLLTPLPADASQMAAIATADRGKDFIMIGPPGTGKSQTISNLIAHLLGKGKTVLFVSEKTAALEVVYRRLDDIGLGRFCLELHSHKARKADVLAQLRRAWEGARAALPESWEKEAERLQRLRNQLNRFVNHLHMRRRNGLTAYHAIGVKVLNAELAARVSCWWPSADQHDEAQLASMREAVENLQVQAVAVESMLASPFQLVVHSDWSPHWEAQVVERAGRLSAAARTLESAAESFLNTVGIKVADGTLRCLDALADLAAVLLDSWRRPAALALGPDGSSRMAALEEAAQRLKAYAEAQAGLSCAYDPFAWRKLDGDEIARRWQGVRADWWPKRWFTHRWLINDMKANGAHGTPVPAHDAPLLKRLRVEGEAIDRLDRVLSGLADWQGHATAPEAAKALHTLWKRVRAAVDRLADDGHTLSAIRGKIRTLLHDGNDLLAPDAIVGRAARSLLTAYQEVRAACESFEAVVGRSVREHFANTEDALAAMREAADTIAARRGELRDWCQWRRRRTEALHLELGPLVKAIEEGRVLVTEIKKTFEAAYCAWWSAAVIGEDEVLRTFSAPEHVATIEKFRAADTEFQKLTAAYIAATLSGRVPDATDVQRRSSWGILSRELQKKARHKPVRQVLHEIPDVVMTLTPCLMMSPLSVAQYLPPQALFDVVIFDEASQITVWDAVGSLARGRQVIVAGDPKQMPPTNFFTRSDDDPDGEVDVEGDLESILDEMLAASIPWRDLNLHYRSRRESLIAFSNDRYYGNRLITFPAPVHPDHGILLIRPDGFYARGGARHNEGEARAIVAEVVRRLTHTEEEVRRASIGVVTFNAEQQALIENLLDNARAEHPEIEWAFSRVETLEPVFVKNLETVQGDERDVILFSVTYGPDRSNHVSMNFGPLNRAGGERRLNVAVTRARSEMLVFSTLTPDRIDLSRTQARAVADLKHFLEYAERGPAALGAAVHGPKGDIESPLEAAVARGLREKGWDVHPQVGVSAYRIDLGIVHPDMSGRYLAGVECDGAMYHSSAFARERDKLRQTVLERLGWTLFRVWSTDWWTHPAKALDTLHDALTRHLEADKRKRAEQKQADEASVTSPVSLTDRPGVASAARTADATYTDGEAGGTAVSTPALWPAEYRLVSDRATPTVTKAGELTHPAPDNYRCCTDDPDAAYVYADLDQERHPADPERFYSEDYETPLAAMIDHVIDTEGPIHEDVLVRRIVRYHGFQRAGRQIRDIVIKIAKRHRSHTREEVGLFFWSRGAGKERHAPARYKGRDAELRSVKYICKEELRAIKAALSLGDDPVELARALGISRLSQGARKRLSKALASNGNRDI